MRVVIDAVARMLALYEDQEDVRIEHQRMYEFAEPVAINGFEGEGVKYPRLKSGACRE